MEEPWLQEVLNNFERGIVVHEDWSNPRNALDCLSFGMRVEQLRRRDTQRRLAEARRALEEARARTEVARARTRVYTDITEGLRERRERMQQLGAGPENESIMAELRQEIDALWVRYEEANAMDVQN